MNFLQRIKDNVLVYDGSKGYMLQLAGLTPGECPEHWNLTNRDKVYKLHKEYVESGCDVIQTNTFSANRIQLEKHRLGDKLYEINYEGVRIAKEATRGTNIYVAASIGPTGTLMEPSGLLTFEQAYDVYKEQVQAVVDAGVDLINFETFTDIAEMRAAILASKDISDTPVIASMAFEQNFRTLMGTTPFACAKIMLAVGADVIGTNCSFGPESMGIIVDDMAKTGQVISVKPNAGLPTLENNETVYAQSSHEFCNIVTKFPKYNAHLVGGCCGTTPEFTKEIKEQIKLEVYTGEIDENIYLFSLSSRIDISIPYKKGILSFNDSENLEDIIDLAYDLVDGDISVVELVYKGNDEKYLSKIIKETQNVIKTPIIINSHNEKAVENALLVYAGIAGVIHPVLNNYGAIKIS